MKYSFFSKKIINSKKGKRNNRYETRSIFFCHQIIYIDDLERF